jgi:chromosome segregation ATPase
MPSLLSKVSILQQKKMEAARLRRKGEREIQKAQYLTKRSASGLATIQRKIEASKEELEDVSGVLTQKLARQESIQRLLNAAEENLRREKETKEQTEQEIEFSESDEIKLQAMARLRIISDRINEIVDEIKQRNNTLKKIVDDIEDYKRSRVKISTKIQKQAKSKPELQNLLKTSKQKTQSLAKQVASKTKQEELAKRNLILISKKLSELASRRRKRAISKKKKSKLKSKLRKVKSKIKKKKLKIKLKRRIIKKAKAKLKKTKRKIRIHRKLKSKRRK